MQLVSSRIMMIASFNSTVKIFKSRAQIASRKLWRSIRLLSEENTSLVTHTDLGLPALCPVVKQRTFREFYLIFNQWPIKVHSFIRTRNTFHFCNFGKDSVQCTESSSEEIKVALLHHAPWGDFTIWLNIPV